MMTQDWFVGIGGVVEGPLSKENLEKDSRLTPDVLICRSDLDEWRPISEVPEFSDLFSKLEPTKKAKRKELEAEEKKSVEVKQVKKEESQTKEPQKEEVSQEELLAEVESKEPTYNETDEGELVQGCDEVILEIQEEPPLFKFWLVVFLLGLTYICYHFYFIQ
ncbi:MAG: DUF4339 domain-containing protein [Chlamydiota bacterium]|nr:DUF4339 domain-containing protein [Chlamydiota bacterium]